ncbi:ribosomal RNA-processing protein 7 homolog A-like [Abrus precatorius]|uniref:Ribosomal RNA-processing protein 7 homolog A-like n=1 Tax=Abrus precatorius TaxID=3816 RepID=A0A8B8L9T2_ABRPR|nr:ribosomal RNA-processing protein 7 homolog A-like [Abrus precatorius]
MKGKGKSKAEKLIVEKKRKRKNQKNADAETDITLNIQDGVVNDHPLEVKEIQDFKEHGVADIVAAIKPCRSKKTKKKRIKDESFGKVFPKSPEREGSPDHEEIYVISSGDEDCSKGMKKWIMEYHESRLGLNVLQHQIDDFITAHEEKLEEERREKEACAAEGGWTVVVHHKGRKKTTDSESGVAVVSVAQAAVENKMAKKKHKGVGLDFYRFQKKEAQRNEIMTLQSKFEEDKKRLQQLRAARKFRPY